jgi:archaemetzincin
LNAIGPTRQLSPLLQRAFDPGDDFEAISEPGPSDWLAEHLEPGQTFADFEKSRPHRPDKQRATIYFLPLGKFDEAASPKMEDLRECAAAFFDLETKILPAIPLDGAGIKSRQRRNSRRQFLTKDILQLLRRQLPTDAYCLLGITMEDIYPDESWNYVFGQASLRDRVGVYSFARYAPEFYGQKRTEESRLLLLERSLGVLFHETSHMFGMRHCIYFQCLVNGSNSLEESDTQPLHLCPVCLRKLHASVGFDIVDRYRKLQALYNRLGLTDEAEWISRRLEHIAPAAN